MSSFRHPEFLSPGDEPDQRVRCPIHGFIHYSRNERSVIDYPLFQRLRRIRQLALTEYVYPGATHTRFEHSLGVMEVATRMFDALAARHGAEMEAQFQHVDHFRRDTLTRARQYLRLAALLHDVGHTCFSHAVEEVINRREHGHEALGRLVITEEALLGRSLQERFGEECPGWVSLILSGESLPPELLILTDLLSSQIDADRTDYLLRDSLHCGVDYGRFDYLRLVEGLTVWPEDQFGVLRLAVRSGSIHSVEALILARYQMNTQVYFHRGRRLLDRYLERYFRALGDDCPRSPEEVLGADDFGMLVRMRQDAQDPGELGKWARRLVQRKLHRLVHQTGDDAGAMDARRSARVHRRLKEAHPEIDFLSDVMDSTNHKFLVPGDPSDRDRVSLKVVGLTRAQEIGEVSKMLAQIPRVYQCARIFADIPQEKPELKQELQSLAERFWLEEGS